MAVRKARYASGRHTQSLRGGLLTPNAGVISRYYRRLKPLIDRMTAETSLQLKALFTAPKAEVYFAQDASLADQAKHLMTSLQFQFDNLFAAHSTHIATAMLKENANSSEDAIRASMGELAEGLSLNTGVITAELGEVFTATTVANVALIKSISNSVP